MSEPRDLLGNIQGSSSSSGGGGITAWSAGTYAAGSLVTRGPYLWRANNSTSEDPLSVEGNLGAGADWAVQTTVGSGMVQSGTELLLINNVNGMSTTGYRQNVISGFLGKMLIVDLNIQGSADWVHFGIFDSSAVQTATNINSAASGFWGVNLNIYNGSPPRFETALNGVFAGATVGYSNSDFVNAGTGYSRWYLSMLQNGANWDLTLYRDKGSVGSTFTSTLSGRTEDILPVAQFLNQARPSFTNWRFVVGARTGGSAGIFKCRGAWVRNLISGNWTAMGKLPYNLG